MYRLPRDLRGQGQRRGHKRLLYPYWEDSPYNDKKDLANTKHCQTCHMRQVPTGDDASALVKGTLSDHRTIGANMTVPLIYGLKEQYRQTERFLKDGIMTLQVVAPSRAAPGSDMEFLVRAANAKIGHIFPSGPEGELMEAWTEVTARTESGKLLYGYGLLDGKAHLDDKHTYVYRISPVGADGKPLELDRHRSWMFSEDELHVISPREYHETSYKFRIPAGESSRRIRIQARLRLRKHNQGFVDWLVGQGKLMVPIVDLARDSAEVSVVSDPAQASEAAAFWRKTIQTVPPELEGFRKKVGFLTPQLTEIMPVFDKAIMSRAQDAFRHARYREALSLLDSLSPSVRSRPGLVRLRRAVEQSARERRD